MSVTITKENYNFIDFDFNFGSNPISANINLKRNANAIRQSVINLLMLKKGDKPFHPEIRSPISFHLFDNFSLQVAAIVESDIKRYINYYEPRIVVNSVSINTTNANTINFSIIGTIKNTIETININFLVDRLR